MVGGERLSATVVKGNRVSLWLSEKSITVFRGKSMYFYPTSISLKPQ